MTRLLLSFCLVLLAAPAFGQDEDEPELLAESAYSFTQESPDGRFVFVMIAPDEVEADAEDLEEGLVSVVRQRYAQSGLYKKGEPKAPLWTVDWFAPGVYLADDGIHLIRQGVAAQKPEDEAVTFFAEGKAIKTVKVRELVSAPCLLELREQGLNWRRSDRFDVKAGRYEVRTRFRERFLFDLKGEVQESERPLRRAELVLGALALLALFLAFRAPRPSGPWSEPPPRKGALLHILVNGGLAVGAIFFLTWSRLLPVHSIFDEWGFMRIGLLATTIILTAPFTLVLRALDSRLSPAAVAATPYLGAGLWAALAVEVTLGGALELPPTSHLHLAWGVGGLALILAWLGLGISQARIPAAAGRRSALLAHTIGAVGLIGAFNLVYALVFRLLGVFVIGLSNGPSWQTDAIAAKILDEGLAMGLVFGLLLVFGTRSFGLRDRRAALGRAAGQ